MAGFVKTYDPKKVIISFNGVPISGFADGSFVKVTAATDRWTKKTGADGEVARARSNDETSEVSITLQQTSLSNTALSAIELLDRTAGTGIGALNITDLAGVSLFFWPQAWIKKTPDFERGKDLTDVPWTFDTGNVVSETINGAAN